jgi:tRNA(Ile)-lysidine synthase
VLRPLLHFRKAELKAFIAARQIPFREDSTNAQLEAERNRMRHKTLPMLRDQFGPSFETDLLRHIETIRVNDDSWRQAAKAWLQGDFRSLPERLQKEIVIVQLEQLDIAASGKVLNEILASVAKPVTVAPRLLVVMDANGRLTLRDEPNSPKPLWIDLHLGDDHAEFSGGRLTWSINNVEATDTHATDVMVFDADAVGQFIKLRLPEEGDHVRLSGRGSERPLLDVLARNKIPKEKRSSVVVAETEHGQIFWVEGLRITEDFKVTDITSFVVEWRWKRP